MGKSNRQSRQQQNQNNTKPGEVMSQTQTVTASEVKREETKATQELANALQHVEQVEIKKEALEIKKINETEVKKPDEKKEGLMDLAFSIPKAIWNKGLVPAYEFCKGIATRAWGWCVNSYNTEVATFKQLGAVRYLMGRGSMILIKTLKLVAAVSVAYLINSLLVNYAGISLFSPMTLGIIALVALVAVVAKSYMDQKDAGAEFSFKATGTHIIDAVAAA